MLKAVNNLEITKESGNYILTLPVTASLGELFDVLHQMKCFVFEKMNEIQKMEQAHKENSEVKAEEPKPAE